MSHDLVAVVREQGRLRTTYDRWAALQLDRSLLRGPDECLSYLLRLEALAEPMAVSWLCGVVFVDLDRRHLLYWADQFFGPPWLQRYYRRLLGEAWPGWTCRWAARGVHDFADELGGAFATLAGSPRDRDGSHLVELQLDRDEEAWAQHRASLDADIAQYGETVVRGWHVSDLSVWATIRSPDGVVEDHLCGKEINGCPLVLLGPRLVERLATYPAASLSDVDERDIAETVFVDVAARRVCFSVGRPLFLGFGASEKRWARHTVSQHDEGARGHARLTGRDSSRIHAPTEEIVEAFAQQLDHCLGKAFDPMALLEREARRLARESPGSTVNIERAATDGREIGVERGEAARRLHLATARRLADEELHGEQP